MAANRNCGAGGYYMEPSARLYTCEACDLAHKERMAKKFEIRYEDLHGDLGLRYFAPLSGLEPYALPGWGWIWETSSTGEDVLRFLSPEYIENCKRHGPKEWCCEPEYHLQEARERLRVSREGLR